MNNSRKRQTISRARWLLCGLSILLSLVILTACGSAASDYGGRTKLLTAETGWYSGPLWSPAGNQISYSDFEGNETIMNLSDGLLSPMTTGRPTPIQGIGPIIWYEKDAVAYAGWNRSIAERWFLISDLEGNAEIQFETKASIQDLCWHKVDQIFIMSLNAPDRMHGTWLQEYDPEKGVLQPYVGRLYRTADGEAITSIDCHPHRDEIAVAIVSSERPMRIELMSINSSDRRTIYEADGGMDLDELSYSPDGKWLAVRTVEGNSSWLRRGIMLISTAGEEPIRLDLPWRREGVVDLEWSPTSNQLLVRLIHRVGHYSLHLFDVSPWIEE